jgi:hypothetical protein
MIQPSMCQFVNERGGNMNGMGVPRSYPSLLELNHSRVIVPYAPRADGSDDQDSNASGKL